MNILKKIDAIYADTSVKRRFISKSMFWVCSFVGPIFVYGFIVNLLEGDFIGSAVEGAFAVLLFTGIPMIFKKRIDILSISFVYAALLVGIVAGIITKGPSLYAAYIAFTFLMPSLISLAFLGQTVKQALITSIIILGGIIFSYFSKAAPLLSTLEPSVETSLATLLIPPVVMTILGAILTTMIVYSTESIITKLSESEEESGKRLDGMKAFFQSLKETINVGETLNGSARNSLEHTETITGNLESMEKAVENLKAQILSTQNIHESIDRAGQVVLEGSQTQSSAVEQSASAVEEMASSIVQMSKTAESRRELIEELVDTEKDVSVQIKAGQKSFDKVKQSAGEMLNVVSVISDIAERTNLLAMNAAIEAAHAGASGRGFAVVAQEIRKLAEEAGNNSQKIKEIIEGSIKGIDEAVTMNSRVGSEFHGVSEKVREIDNALSEIINGFSELASGTREITHAVENLTEINSSVQTSVSEVTDQLARGRSSVDEISKATEGIISSMNHIAGDSHNIRSEAENIYKIGQDNIKHIRLLEEKLS
ncbi:MAG: hypothetical protein JXR86_10265 [Spirochaetales bacterium]|nr:hypothetical protein [Spirochaetales bacterium]